MGVLTREVASLYAAFAAGQPSPLPELAVQYAGFARWQCEWEGSADAGRQLAWWRERLAGAPDALEIPTDWPRPPVQRLRSGTAVRRIPTGPSQAAAAFCREQGVTLFMGLLAVFELLLHARTGKADFLVGVDIANRDQLDTEALIGFFVNQLALRADLSGDPTFLQLLERVRDFTVGAYAHQDLPFDRLVEELRPRRAPDRNPLIQVMFSQYNVPVAAPAPSSVGGLEIRPLELEGGAAIYDLNLYFLDTPEGLRALLRYNADLFEPATAARWLEEYETVLGWVLASPGARVSELAERLAAERRREQTTNLNKARQRVLQTARRGRRAQEPK
jgi:aspartate racemase